MKTYASGKREQLKVSGKKRKLQRRMGRIFRQCRNVEKGGRVMK